ncbi:MAG: hypothetical protein M3258_09650 [Thermoproteota archaeon]|nr:hypothetical protein [Thermoproteota archaeon]
MTCTTSESARQELDDMRTQLPLHYKAILNNLLMIRAEAWATLANTGDVRSKAQILNVLQNVNSQILETLSSSDLIAQLVHNAEQLRKSSSEQLNRIHKQLEDIKRKEEQGNGGEQQSVPPLQESMGLQLEPQQQRMTPIEQEEDDNNSDPLRYRTGYHTDEEGNCFDDDGCSCDNSSNSVIRTDIDIMEGASNSSTQTIPV